MADHSNDLDPDEISKKDSKIRQISKRKVIYVELDEEITSVFEKIQNLNYQDVYLVIPDRAILLQSVVNLQILKKKVSERGQSLSLITNDPIGSNLAHQAGISVFDQISPEESHKISDPEDEDTVAPPITALGNEVDDERPERLTHKKLSIFDVVRESRQKKIFSVSGIKGILKSRKENQLFKEPSRFALGAPSKKSLGALVVASLCILLIISYVALPGATVTVTPQSNVIEQSANITLADANVYGTNPSVEGSHVMVTYPIDVSMSQSITYTATGQIFDGTNASGTVTFINERSTAWPLVAFTRIQTEDGLVYRIQEAVTVPASTSEGFGTTDVYVVADEEDAYGRVMGEKGNIGPSSFILPGLREESQKELYARSSESMTGGSTLVTLQITQEDMDAAEALLRSQMSSDAEGVLLEEVERRNALNATNLALLTGYGAIETSEPSLDVPSELVDSVQDQFEVSGRMTVSGYAFDYDEFLAIMTEELENRKSPDKALLKIDENSISYELFEVDEAPGILRFTATLKGIESYDLNPETENGAKLVKKIKEHIAGKSIKEAEDYVQNLPEINKVKISSWPVWAPTIPTVLENIEINVDETWLAGMTDSNE